MKHKLQVCSAFNAEDRAQSLSRHCWLPAFVSTSTGQTPHNCSRIAWGRTQKHSNKATASTRRSWKRAHLRTIFFSFYCELQCLNWTTMPSGSWVNINSFIRLRTAWSDTWVVLCNEPLTADSPDTCESAREKFAKQQRKIISKINFCHTKTRCLSIKVVEVKTAKVVNNFVINLCIQANKKLSICGGGVLVWQSIELADENFT